MSKKSLSSAAALALLVAIVLSVGAAVQAESDKDSTGQVVKIGRSDADQADPSLPPPDEAARIQLAPQQQQPPKYWIGLLGGTISPDSPLRAQLDLPENAGLIVANVMPNSPASKAGLKQHDILLRANDRDLHDMQDLVALVAVEGPNKGKIVLDVLRHNKHESIDLVPEERPADARMPQPMGGLGMMGDSSDMNDLLSQFNNRLGMNLRNFGPGIAMGGPGIGNVPNGTSVSIQKSTNGPAHIIVKRGNDTWDIVGDDPEALKKLPDDLRPMVEQMVQGNSRNMAMPHFNRGQNMPGFDEGVREQLERMDKQLQEMRKQLHTPNSPPADQPSDENAPSN